MRLGWLVVRDLPTISGLACDHAGSCGDVAAADGARLDHPGVDKANGLGPETFDEFCTAEMRHVADLQQRLGRRRGSCPPGSLSANAAHSILKVVLKTLHKGYLAFELESADALCGIIQEIKHAQVTVPDCPGIASDDLVCIHFQRVHGVRHFPEQRRCAGDYLVRLGLPGGHGKQPASPAKIDPEIV